MNRTKKLNKPSSIQKTLMIGGLASTLLLGGVIPSAFAAEEAAAPVAEQQQVDVLAPILSTHLNQLVSEVAMIADADASDIQNNLDQGQTLVQSSGLTGGELLNRLSDALKQDIEAKLGGELDSSQLSSLQSEGRSKLLAAITTPGYRPEALSGAFKPEAIIQKHLSSLIADTAAYGDRDVADVEYDLASGRTLQQASGLTGSELFNNIIADVNNELSGAAASANVSNEVLEQAKVDASIAIKNALTQEGFNAESAGQQVGTDLTAVLSKRLATIIDDAAMLADENASDVRARLEGGSNLVSATGMNATDLINGLQDMADQDLDIAAASSGVDANGLAAAKADARSQISKLVSENGLVAQAAEADVDAQAVIDRRLASLVDDVSFFSGNDKSVIQEAVANGQSLLTASGMASQELVDKIAEQLNQELEHAFNGQANVGDKLENWKAEAKRQVIEKLS